MRTEAQREASRKNGAKSHGPTTARGKANSSENSYRHGLTAKRSLSTTENPAAFVKHLEAYHEKFQPLDDVERNIVDGMALCHWRERRAWSKEATLIDIEMDRMSAKVDEKYGKVDHAVRYTLAYKRLCDKSHSMSLLIRYENSHRRAFHHKLTELIQLRNGLPPVQDDDPSEYPNDEPSAQGPGDTNFYETNPTSETKQTKSDQAEPENAAPDPKTKDPRATKENDERTTTNDERRAERRATSHELRATELNDERTTTNDERRAERQATSYEPRATSYELRATQAAYNDRFMEIRNKLWGRLAICGGLATRLARATTLLFAAIVCAAQQKAVTVTEGTNIAATVSPDQSTIIVDLQGSLWSIPFRGGTAKQLTDPFLEPARPDFSPKGDLIAFQAYQGGTFHIWTMKPDGTGLRQLTDGHGDDREPRFSPDGTKIAFSSDRAFKGSYDLWVADGASGKLTQWTSATADEYEPAWSPDGSELAFVSGVGANATSLQAVNAAGSIRIIESVPAGSRLNSPSFSPDGKRLAYMQFHANKSRLMVSGKQVAEYDDVFPFPAAWLSANRLLYTANGKIRITALDTGETQTVPFEAQFTLNRPAYAHKKVDLDSGTPRQVLGIVSPALSPDGRHVVFEALNQLWVMEIGGKPRQLTNDGYYKTDPAWSPDGKRIAYSSDKAGTEDLYVLDLETKAEKRITSFADSAEVSAAWSPDGKMLAYQDQAGVTYVLDIDTGRKRQIAAALFAPSKPSWSANGKTIAIAALKPYTRRFREGTSQILTVDVSNGGVTYTEPAPFKSLSTRGEDGPIYSPGGTSMAFVMESVLWIRPVDRNGIPSGAAKQINHEVTDAPTWSGDSKKLLYLSNGKLRLISVEGGNPSTVQVDLSWRPAQPPARTIIHAGRLWDGRGAAVRSDVDITIVNGRIQSIEPHRARADSKAQFVDASKLTVIPGLWESHTHEWISGKFYGDRLGRLWLAYGVTALQSQGDPVYRAAETREAFASGERAGPRFFATGEAIDGERIYYNFMRPVTSEAQLELELSRARALDYDLVKTYVRLPHAMQEKAMSFAHGNMGVVAASHYMLPGMSYGMDVMTHVSATARLGFAYTRSLCGVSYQDMRSLFVASGMFDISAPFMSSALYAEDPKMVDDERLLKLNTPWDLAVVQGKRDLSQGKKPDTLPVGLRASTLADVATTRDSLKKEEDTVAAIRRAGGNMLAGTDSPLDSVATALHLNLRAQVKYGLEPWQALQTATLYPAKAFGVEKDLGTIEPGKLADLVFVSGDPLRDIKDAANVQFVMKGGRLYSVAELMAPFKH